MVERSRGRQKLPEVMQTQHTDGFGVTGRCVHRAGQPRACAAPPRVPELPAGRRSDRCRYVAALRIVRSKSSGTCVTERTSDGAVLGAQHPGESAQHGHAGSIARPRANASQLVRLQIQVHHLSAGVDTSVGATGHGDPAQACG